MCKSRIKKGHKEQLRERESNGSTTIARALLHRIRVVIPNKCSWFTSAPTQKLNKNKVYSDFKVPQFIVELDFPQASRADSLWSVD